MGPSRGLLRDCTTGCGTDGSICGTSYLRLTIGYLKATVVHIRVTLGHLRVTIGNRPPPTISLILLN